MKLTPEKLKAMRRKVNVYGCLPKRNIETLINEVEKLERAFKGATKIANAREVDLHRLVEGAVVRSMLKQRDEAWGLLKEMVELTDAWREKDGWKLMPEWKPIIQRARMITESKGTIKAEEE